MKHRFLSLSLFALCLVAYLFSPADSQALIQLTQVPFEFFSPTDTTDIVTVKWLELPAALPCSLKYGLSPGVYSMGSVPETGPSAGEQSVQFTPAKRSMKAGLYYCVIKSGGEKSLEFQLVIEAQSPPAAKSPLGKIGTTTPLFDWNPVTGVPYYAVLVSDTKITLTETTDPVTGEKKTKIEGANIIWEVISPTPGVVYGSPDPSGFYSMTPPPLTKSATYYWAVLNCYGPNPALISTVQAGVNEFTVNLPQPVLPPVPLSPSTDETLSVGTITFRWNKSAGAMGYRLYLYELKEESGSTASLPVWDGLLATSDTLFDFQASNSLRNATFLWKIAAVDSTGGESVSLATRFFYKIRTGSIDINSRNDKGEVLPRVNVKLETLEGFSQIEPIVTGSEGHYNAERMPLGTYILTGTREGYESGKDTVVVSLNPVTGVGTNESATLSMAPSPGAVSGRTTDKIGAPVSGATIRALLSGAERSAGTDGSGTFSLGVTAGTWSVYASKSGYRDSKVRTIAVGPGETIVLPDSMLVLEKSTATIAGKTVNEKGLAVSSASVTLTLSGGAKILTTQTDYSGQFSFTVDDGSWVVVASKTGFVSSQARLTTVGPGERKTVDPDLVLTAQGGTVLGSITDGKKNIGNALVEAISRTSGVFSASSDVFGQYRINLPPGAAFEIMVTKTGYTSPGSRQVILTPGQTLSGTNFVLTQNASSISGTVKSSSGSGMSGIAVSTGGASTVSAMDGTYTLSVAEGTQVVSASKEGYLSSGSSTITVSPGQNITGVDFTMTPNASVIKGTVTSGGSASYLANVKAINASTFDSVKTTTDLFGNYSISVEPGNWKLVSSKPLYLSSPDTISLVVAPAQTVLGKNFVLTLNVARFTGTVIDSSSRAALRSVDVAVTLGPVSTTTDITGKYTFEIPPGSGSFTLSKSGYIARTVNINAGPGDMATFPTLALHPAQYLVSGTVRDENGKVLSGARIESGTLFATADAKGKYQLNFTAQSLSQGILSLTASKTGYLQKNEQVAYASQVYSATKDIVLTSDFVLLTGTVTDGAATIAGALVVANSSNGGGAVTTDASGNYQFKDSSGRPYLVRGTYSVAASKSGHTSQSVAGLDFSVGANFTQDLVLAANTGSISGTVKDAVGTAVSGATVRAQLGGATKGSAVSDASGNYLIGGLPISLGSFTVLVSMGGYASPPDVQNVLAGSTGVDFQLTLNNGYIRGTVQSADNAPIFRVSIAAEDSLGHAGVAESDSLGHYSIESLAVVSANYNVKARLLGYAQEEILGIPVNSQSINFTLSRLRGPISGRVTLAETGARLTNVLIKATSYSRGDFFGTVTDTGGRFILRVPVPDSYGLAASKSGHVSGRSSYVVTLTEGDSLSGRDKDFTMEAVTLASVAVSGPQRISNKSSSVYSFTATSTTGKSLALELKWSLIPEEAGTIAGGVLDPVDDYIGEVLVVAGDSASGIEGQLTVGIIQLLTPADTAVVSDKEGFRLEIARGAVDVSTEISMRKVDAPSAKRTGRMFSIPGQIYELGPSGLTFTSDGLAVITLPVLSGADPNHASIGKWNATRLRWESLGGTPDAQGGISVAISSFSQYAVLIQAEPLALKDVRLYPNPFSPHVGNGLNIEYRISSTETPTPFVTIKIYNMLGELVRVIAENNPRDKSVVQTDNWDGRGDSAGIELNGRYVLELKVKDASGEKRAVKTVVLIK
ncbi:MAG: carboxypeptidase regulatory-like domain-containing protein [Candidatus Eisenbacteria bacterium]|nr:carboxypeptidase regulatory-like domain-containing protein [Candidatus Eisenbacteria bacterium]